MSRSLHWMTIEKRADQALIVSLVVFRGVAVWDSL
jgi:hypothetical protein